MNDPTRIDAYITLPSGFEYNPLPSPPGEHTPPPPDLGPLAAFRGQYAGNGFNLIFRPNPQNEAGNLPNNVLELNLTKETISFADSLGSVPNRGSSNQPDIFLNGVPYFQVIDDLTVPDAPVRGIHVEPGLWMIVPPTAHPENRKRSIVRMASIPHGSTICAQGSFESFNGNPSIPPMPICPKLGDVTPCPQPSQNFDDPNTSRIPQNLASYGANGSITPEILADPNTILRNAIDGQTILGGTKIELSTNPVLPRAGGGISNIDFLAGDIPNGFPNAFATDMVATFWIEAVEHKVVIEPLGPHEVQRVPIRHRVRAREHARHGLEFLIPAPPEPMPTPVELSILTTQIQYSQLVKLSFAGITWPHASVATLVPLDPIAVPHSVWHRARRPRR